MINLKCFSYDVRGKFAKQPSVWTEAYLNQRAYFKTLPEPATLNINHVDKSDEGEYRCRVDFAKNPSRNSRVQLSIIGEYSTIIIHPVN